MKVCSAVLAAGASSRFGSDKLEVKIGEKTVLERVVETARRFGETILVTRKPRNIPGTIEVINPNWEQGISTSVKLAVAKAGQIGCDFLLIFLGDMPFLKEECASRIVEEAMKDNSKLIVYPALGDKKGFPTLLKKEGFELAESVTGDAGLRQLIERYPSLCLSVTLPIDECYKDVDRPEDIYE